MALAIIGLSYSATEAQTTTTAPKKPCKCATAAKKANANGATTKTGDKYQVCREEGGYYTCCTHKKKVTTKMAAAKTTPVVATVATKSAANNGAHARIAKTSDKYQVCKEQGGYYTCCTHKKKVTTKTVTAKTTPQVAVK